MTPRSLFTIILKILGLLMAVNALSYISQIFVYGFSFLSQTNYNESQILIIVTCLSLFFVFLYYKILKLMFLKTDVVVDKLSLDKHFDEETFNFNINPKIMLKYSIITIGLVIFTYSVFDFFEEIINYFSIANNQIAYEKAPSKMYIIIEFVKAIVGYLFIFNSNYIAGFIETKQYKDSNENEDNVLSN